MKLLRIIKILSKIIIIVLMMRNEELIFIVWYYGIWTMCPGPRMVSVFNRMKNFPLIFLLVATVIILMSNESYFVILNIFCFLFSFRSHFSFSVSSKYKQAHQASRYCNKHNIAEHSKLDAFHLTFFYGQ